MKRIGLAVLVLFLSACGTVDAAPNPYDNIAQGESLISKGKADILAAEQAQIDADKENARQIAKDNALTENEIRRLMAPIDARAAELEIRRKEAALEAEINAQKMDEQERAQKLELDRIELERKRAQLATEQKRQERKQAYDRFLYTWFYPILVLLVMFGLAYLLYKYFTYRMTFANRRNMFYNITGVGIIRLIPAPDGRTLIGELMTPEGSYNRNRPRLDLNKTQADAQTDIEEVEDITPSVTRSPIRQPAKVDPLVEMALDLVGDSMDVYDEKSTLIASVDKLKALPNPRRKWNADTRQYVVNALELTGIVKDGRSGKKTELTGRYQNLEILWDDLAGGRIKLRLPAPPRPLPHYAPAD